MRRVGRAAALGVPVWLVLLLLLPLTGMGPLACMSGATLLTAGAVVWADRRSRRRGPEADDGPPDGARTPMSPLAAAGLTLAGVALLAYVIFVIVTAGS